MCFHLSLETTPPCRWLVSLGFERARWHVGSLRIPKNYTNRQASKLRAPHHPSQKMVVVNSVGSTATTISDPSSLQKDKALEKGSRGQQKTLKRHQDPKKIGEQTVGTGDKQALVSEGPVSTSEGL